MRSLLALLIVAVLAIPAEAKVTRNYRWAYRGPANGLQNFIVTQGNNFYGGNYGGYRRSVQRWDLPPTWGVGASYYSPGGAYFGPQNYNYGGYGGNVWYSESTADVDAPIRELPAPLIIENPHYSGKPLPELRGHYRRETDAPEPPQAEGSWERAEGLDYAD